MSESKVHLPAFAKIGVSIAAIALLLVFLALTLHGQNHAPVTEGAPIVTNVDEVAMDLVAHGKGKKPILDLRPEDLRVEDNGTPVKISGINLVSGKPGSERLVTFVFDRLDSAGSTNARNLAAKIMKSLPQEGFSFAALSIAGRLRLQQDFTFDREELRKAITLASAASNSERTSTSEAPERMLIDIAKNGTGNSGTTATREERFHAQVMLAALEDSQRIVQEQHTSPSLAGLLALVRNQRRFPGRKVVIYFAQDLRLDSGSGVVTGSIVEAASRSGVSIYSVDASAVSNEVNQDLMSAMSLGNSVAMSSSRGSAPAPLTGPPARSFADTSTPGMQSQISNQYQRFEMQEGNDIRGPLAKLADDTGGAYIRAGQNPKKALRKLIDEMTTYYEMTYVPPSRDYDGLFHPVRITPLRSGLTIQSRSGYYALPPDSGSGPKAFEVPLLKMLADTPLPADLKFRSGILHFGNFGTGNANTLVVEVPVSELETQDDPNTNLYSCHVSIVAQIRNKAGEIVEHFSEDVPRHGALDTKGATREVVTVQRHFLEQPGEYTLETAVLDRNSGKKSAQRSTFVIPENESASGLSDIALVRRMEPFPVEVDPDEPLRYGNSRVVPALIGRLPKGTKEISVFCLIHASTQSSEETRMEIEVTRNGEPIAQVPLQLRKMQDAGSVPYVATIQSASLPPGEYQVIETMTQGEKVTQRSVAFGIEGPQLASANVPEKLSPKDQDSDLPQDSHLEAMPLPSHALVITPLPPNSAPVPSPDELQAIIAAARKHALGYSKSLPNFVCIEVTNRSVDPGSNGAWKHRDSFSELLRYVDNQETRTMLERNGQKTSSQRSDLDPGWTISTGEFGPLLKLVFGDSSKADFRWQEAATLGSDIVQVLSYRVARENATINLSDNSGTIGAGFHGLVYVDKATGGIRRITLQGDDLPHNFSIHAASMTLDYDFIRIGTHDYLMPLRATLAVQRGKRQIDLNEMTFRNYRRYASQAKIVYTP